MEYKKILLLLLLVSVGAAAQVSNPSVQYQTTAPSGACSAAPPIRVVDSTGTIYTCDNGTWAAASGGGGGGGSQTISNLAFSQSDTTIVASWNTGGNSNSVLVCGGKNAVDNNFQSNVTFHQAVVTGLTPSTLYSCAVTSGGTTSTPQNVTTNAAATRTLASGFLIGSATAQTTQGDSFYSFVSNDNKTYITEDDGFGFTGSANAGANMQLGVLTAESTMTGTLVNLLTNYGGAGTSNGTDGPSGAASTNKANGLFGMGGSLYMFVSRNHYNNHAAQAALWGNVIKSNDHGATWNNFVNPSAFTANGSQLQGTGMFATNLYGWCVPVRYAVDDGSNGYLTAGNQIDGANAFVYVTCTDGFWNAGSNLYMLRMSRAQFSSQNPGSPQYWIGSGTPTPATFVNDTNWSSSSTSATAIYTSAGEVNAPDEVFVPALNSYLLLEWFQPSLTDTSNSTWVILSGPTPVGPWTTVGTQSFSPQGYYNPVVQHRSVATNTVTTSIALTLNFSGDYNNATYYHPTYATMTLNPAPLLDAIGVSATFAGSASHLLRAAYSGNAMLIQRASDSTTQAVGFNSNGTVNQSTITTFCSGTTCNVKTLYDQSGSGHDATQTTFANMPVIYTGGAVTTNGVNSQPAMKWDNTERYFALPLTFSGTSFESLLVGTLTSGAIQFSGALEMTDGTHSGGSQAGLINMLDYFVTSPNQLATGTSATVTAALQNFTPGTQFLADSEASPGAQTFLALDGGAFANSTQNTSGTLSATVLDIGTDLPSNTYFWDGFQSDVVFYSTALTTPQRATAHTVESTFFGTP